MEKEEEIGGVYSFIKTPRPIYYGMRVYPDAQCVNGNPILLAQSFGYGRCD
jgi:hypothetical protein